MKYEDNLSLLIADILRIDISIHNAKLDRKHRKLLVKRVEELGASDRLSISRKQQKDTLKKCFLW